ncbi:MAG: Holliday junction branch migration DNA helicase RuvB [Patescibacteria group bacterium]|jgi:Holliday junction DNA helicase RuvB
MPKAKDILTPEEQPDEQIFDISLRPKNLSEYIGQEAVKENLKIAISAAKHRKEPLEHVLLHGSPGLGKTTLAHIIGAELGVAVRITSGPALERAGDVAAILTNLGEGDILFIDEVHRLPRTVEEILYPAMEDFAIDIVVGKGPSARTLRLDLPRVTIIGATTRLALLSAPLRDRFGMSYHLDYYSEKDIEIILERSARILKIPVEPDARKLLASRSRRTPRVANRLLKRVRDFAQVKTGGKVNVDSAKQALEQLGIDPLGLDPTDRRILICIIDQFNGGPVGLSTLGATTGEDIQTLEDVVEPFLLQIGLLVRTPRGRVATPLAYEHLQRSAPLDLQQRLV